MADPWRSLDAEVRRVDEDRWLASRFAARAERRRLLAIYALNYEIARTSEIVHDAGVGAIRLAWWRDAIAATASGQPTQGHPALVALAEAGGVAPAQMPIWTALIEARASDFEPAPFAALSDLARYVDATAGGVVRLALMACGAGADALNAAKPAGLAWGVAGLLRAEPFWRARGRRLLTAEGCSHSELITLARSAYGEARQAARASPAECFAALGYVALTPAYLDALERGGEPPALLLRQLKLVAAAATGRL